MASNLNAHSDQRSSGQTDLHAPRKARTNQAIFRHPVGTEGVELLQAKISSYAFEPHYHETFGLGIIDQGLERFRYRGSEHLVGCGGLVLMNPEELHTGESAQEGGWQYRMIYLHPDTIEQLTGDQGWFFGDVIHRSGFGVNALAEAIQSLWQAESALESQGILLNLTDRLRPFARMAQAAKTDAPHRLQPAMDYLHSHYSQEVSLDQLAASVAMSPSHFLRQFKQQYQITPHRMLMAIRLHRAKQQIASGAPIAQTAIATGLTDQAHLTRHFILRYGITPGRYQKQIRR